jgi:fructokinase
MPSGFGSFLRKETGSLGFNFGLSMSAKKIVGVGELLWDIFPDGRKVAGGAPFNFAFHCHQLGHEAAIVSRVGNDDLGNELRARVQELGLSDEHIQTDRKLPTGTVRVAVNRTGQPSYTIDTGAAWGNLEWTPALVSLTREAGALCHGTLALCGGKKSRDVIDKMALQVHQHKGLTIYDVNLRGKSAARPDERATFWSRWLKVNENELGDLMRCVGESIDDGVPVENERQMLELLQSDMGRDDTVLIITRGEEGAEVFGLGVHHRERAPQVKVIDTVGAGDAFTAAMVCLHLEGRPLQECLHFANHYAARVCEHQGATPHIDRKEVEVAALGSSE